MHGGVFVCSVAIWISFGPVLINHPPESEATRFSEPSRLGTEISLQDQAVIDDISELRQLVGGSPFDSDEIGFKHALANLVDEPALDTQSAVVLESDSARSGLLAGGQDSNTQDSAQPSELNLVEHLRVSAELLDQRANRLERTRDFEKADNLRELADRIRRQARQL